MRGREEERNRAKWHRWMKEIGALPATAKPRGNIPQSTIDHMRMIPYPEVIANARPDDKS